MAERIIEWANRPFPNRNFAEERERITSAYLSSEGKHGPYCMIDAILDPRKDAKEVVKWAIYYTYKEYDADEMEDEEYRAIVLPPV